MDKDGAVDTDKGEIPMPITPDTSKSQKALIMESWNKYLQEKKSGRPGIIGANKKRLSARSNNTSFRSSRRKRPRIVQTPEGEDGTAGSITILPDDETSRAANRIVLLNPSAAPLPSQSRGASAGGRRKKKNKKRTGKLGEMRKARAIAQKKPQIVRRSNAQQLSGAKSSQRTPSQKGGGGGGGGGRGASTSKTPVKPAHGSAAPSGARTSSVTTRRHGSNSRGGRGSANNIRPPVNTAQRSSLNFYKDLVQLNRTLGKRKKFRLICGDIEKISGLRTTESKKAVVQYESGRVKVQQGGKDLSQLLSKLISAGVAWNPVEFENYHIKRNSVERGTADEKGGKKRAIVPFDSNGDSDPSAQGEDMILVPSKAVEELMEGMRTYQTLVDNMRKTVYDTSILVHSVLNRSIMTYSLVTNMKAHSKDLDLEIATHVKHFLEEVPSHVFTDDEHQEAILATSPFQRAHWIDGKFGRGASSGGGGSSGSQGGRALSSVASGGGGSGSASASNKQTTYVTKFNYLVNKDVPDSRTPRYPY